jgi:hypothetical protein
MRSPLIKKILKETPLETRLKVSNEMAFIMLITELGFRENKMWNENDPKEMELLGKLCKFAEEHTKNQMKTIEEWKKDTDENPELTGSN